ncbi:MAG: ATP-binding cassette domain-containing protein [Sedimentisphaerales bacterium]|nr:ATP-binding cassette domain-containing protein [Sedimentisphaerales bacterium]
MRRFSVSKQFDVNVPARLGEGADVATEGKETPSRSRVSERVSTVMRMFGVSIDRLDEHRRTHTCTIEVEDGDIVYITGPSGGGKSVLLRELQKGVPADERISIEQIALPADKAAIDCIRLRQNFGGQVGNGSGTIEALSLLGYAGLSEVFCVLTPPANLSEGQKYRFRLAAALATGRRCIFADEFCSNLDRITAAVIAYNIRRFAKRNGVTFFLASSHEDILADLQPDVLVVKHFTGPAEVTYKQKR